MLHLSPTPPIHPPPAFPPSPPPHPVSYAACLLSVQSLLPFLFLAENSKSFTLNPNGKFSADSAVGSNGHGSRNLEDVEEADIEAGQILTALKSSYSPIRFTTLCLNVCMQ